MSLLNGQGTIRWLHEAYLAAKLYLSCKSYPYRQL